MDDVYQDQRSYTRNCLRPFNPKALLGIDADCVAHGISLRMAHTLPGVGIMKLCALVFGACFIVASAGGGCSVYMAANQPGQKDLSLLSKGQPRSKLLAEFGTPIHTEMKDGQRKDIFTFTQGYHGGVRAGRAILHGVADVATLGLWEVVGTPTEGYMNGTQLSAEVTYDAQDVVANVVPLRGTEEITKGTNLPTPDATLPVETSSTAKPPPAH